MLEKVEIFLSHTPYRPKGHLAYTVKCEECHCYSIYVWDELRKYMKLYTVVKFHELIHVALAIKYNKKRLYKIQRFDNVGDKLMALADEIVNQRRVFEELLKKENPFVARILDELWGKLFEQSQEEVLAHLYSILEYYSWYWKDEYVRLKNIMRELNVLNVLPELHKKIFTI